MSNPFMTEIRIMSFNFAPQGWAQCNGQLLPINQNQALFSLLGTTYGGDGRVNFGLPDLRGRAPIHMGSGHTLGERGGEQAHTLTLSELPMHVHTMQARAAGAGLQGGDTPAANKSVAEGIAAGPNADVNIYGTASPNAAMGPSSITNAGGSQAHLNMQPFLTLTFCIALQGIFPSQN
jgi:microcystin-dependent protein